MNCRKSEILHDVKDSFAAGQPRATGGALRLAKLGLQITAPPVAGYCHARDYEQRNLAGTECKPDDPLLGNGAVLPLTWCRTDGQALSMSPIQTNHFEPAERSGPDRVYGQERPALEDQIVEDGSWSSFIAMEC
jgi:hypothetical protein